MVFFVIFEEITDKVLELLPDPKSSVGYGRDSQCLPNIPCAFLQFSDFLAVSLGPCGYFRLKLLSGQGS